MQLINQLTSHQLFTWAGKTKVYPQNIEHRAFGAHTLGVLSWYPQVQNTTHKSREKGFKKKTAI
jgi:hypothetical protein